MDFTEEAADTVIGSGRHRLAPFVTIINLLGAEGDTESACFAPVTVNDLGEKSNTLLLQFFPLDPVVILIFSDFRGVWFFIGSHPRKSLERLNTHALQMMTYIIDCNCFLHKEKIRSDLKINPNETDQVCRGTRKKTGRYSIAMRPG
jgi:hypothetical protein